MYLRLFRHTGYESILEGEITETGVGFVMKRRLDRIWNLFNFLPGRRNTVVPVAPNDSIPASGGGTPISGGRLPFSGREAVLPTDSVKSEANDTIR